MTYFPVQILTVNFLSEIYRLQLEALVLNYVQLMVALQIRYSPKNLKEWSGYKRFTKNLHMLSLQNKKLSDEIVKKFTREKPTHIFRITTAFLTCFMLSLSFKGNLLEERWRYYFSWTCPSHVIVQKSTHNISLLFRLSILYRFCHLTCNFIFFVIGCVLSWLCLEVFCARLMPTSSLYIICLRSCFWYSAFWI